MSYFNRTKLTRKGHYDHAAERYVSDADDVISAIKASCRSIDDAIRVHEEIGGQSVYSMDNKKILQIYLRQLSVKMKQLRTKLKE